MRIAAMVLAMASVAVCQDANRVFQFHHIETARDLNEFATTVRTISDNPQVSVDTAQKSASVSGNPNQIAIAEWLFLQLDSASADSTQEFKVSPDGSDIVRIFYLKNTATVQQFQEIATTVRLITETRRVYTCNTPRALVVRGTADQIAATAFLTAELDQPADAKRADSRTYQMIDTGNHGETAVRVFYLPYAATVQQFQEVGTVIRTVGEIRRVFTYNAPRALVVRGTADQVAMVDWTVHELGNPSTADASGTYAYAPDPREHENVLRVFYVRDVGTVDALQQLATDLRNSTKMRLMFSYNEAKAIVARGTPNQMSAAEQMLQDRARQAAAK